MKPDAWFDVERVAERTFALREPGHWEEPNSYLFVGAQRAALVDTGLGIAPIRPVVERLTDRPAIVLTTHVHWDHIGGHGEFADLCVHESDAAWLERGLPLSDEAVRGQLMREPLRRSPPASFDPKTYKPFCGRPVRLLQDGETIDLGDRVLRVLHTPGHAPGHLCVFESETGLLCTGDLLYRGTIYADYPSTDPVALRDSFARLARLTDVLRILPGHNDLDVPASWIVAGLETLDRLGREGLLRHGTGTHTVPESDLQFRF